MTNFTRNIRDDVESEIDLAVRSYSGGNAEQAFRHLENAHVLGQASTRLHVKVHWLMLCWGFRQRDYKEMRGQLLRIIGAATKTALGLVPAGNTGGSNISPIAILPIPDELERKISRAKRKA